MTETCRTNPLVVLAVIALAGAVLALVVITPALAWLDAVAQAGGAK